MLKKMITLLAVVGFAAPSFAAVTITPDSTTAFGGSDFKPSTGVTVMADSTTTDYAVGSKHLNGTLIYFSTNNDSEITTADCASGNVVSGIAVTDTTADDAACSAPSS